MNGAYRTPGVVLPEPCTAALVRPSRRCRICAAPERTCIRGCCVDAPQCDRGFHAFMHVMHALLLLVTGVAAGVLVAAGIDACGWNG